MNQIYFRFKALSLCCAFMTVVITPHFLGVRRPDNRLQG